MQLNPLQRSQLLRSQTTACKRRKTVKEANHTHRARSLLPVREVDPRRAFRTRACLKVAIIEFAKRMKVV